MASSSHAVAKRYSAALWELADSASEAASWLEELQLFAQSFEGSSELRLVLSGGTYAPSERKAVLESLLQKLKPSPQVERFLAKVQEAGRMSAIREITRSFEQKILEANGMVEALVESAIALTKAQTHEVQAKLEAVSGKKVKIIEHVVPALLAGIRVQMGGETIDASLLSTLSKMEKGLMEEGMSEMTLH